MAQEKKKVPGDSVRVSIPGCTKGYIFTVGRRTVDEPREAFVAGREVDSLVEPHMLAATGGRLVFQDARGDRERNPGHQVAVLDDGPRPAVAFDLLRLAEVHPPRRPVVGVDGDLGDAPDRRVDLGVELDVAHG